MCLDKKKAYLAKYYKPLWLRRRLEYKFITGVVATNQADSFFMVQVKPQAVVAKPDKSNWVNDKNVTVCSETGVKFGMFFNRRHHCRITGKVFSNEVCNRLMLIPDRGYYKPQRVFEGVVGLFSQDMREDLVLESEKKTEIIACLQQYVKTATGSEPHLQFLDQFNVTPAAQVRCRHVHTLETGVGCFGLV